MNSSRPATSDSPRAWACSIQSFRRSVPEASVSAKRLLQHQRLDDAVAAQAKLR